MALLRQLPGFEMARKDHPRPGGLFAPTRLSSAVPTAAVTLGLAGQSASQ